MNRYETIFISDPDVSEEIRKQLFEKTTDLIEKQNGFICYFDEWGNKKLAYEIKKRARGHYVRIDYCGDGALVNEMERSFRIDDKVLKFMTIVLQKDVDTELLKEALEREKAEKAAEVETETAAAETKAAAEAVTEAVPEAAQAPSEINGEDAPETAGTDAEAAEDKTEAAEAVESPDAPKTDV